MGGWMSLSISSTFLHFWQIIGTCTTNIFDLIQVFSHIYIINDTFAQKDMDIKEHAVYIVFVQLRGFDLNCLFLITHLSASTWASAVWAFLHVAEECVPSLLLAENQTVHHPVTSATPPPCLLSLFAQPLRETPTFFYRTLTKTNFDLSSAHYVEESICVCWWIFLLPSVSLCAVSLALSVSYVSDKLTT